MLSIENNPKVPSSFKLPAVKTDEKVHELGGTQNPNFCIRNYVSESRDKNIGLNWPFPRHCLQLCLNQGINDVLPPFQPPDLVRAKCSKKTIIEIESVVENSVNVSRAVSEESTDLQRKLEVSEKECKLVVKLSSVSVITQTEDLTSNCSEASDTMASKVCPVCRIFVSTSNTTLNAHIDQCLSSEIDTKSFVNSSSNIKVKPRKKRLMMDIYASAPHCTIEDLDRRNGRNWAASDLTVSALNSEVNKEAKRPKLGPVDTGTDENDGAVYVDSNGIKLRILSKSSDAAVLIPKEDLKLSKHTEDFKDRSNSLLNKKKQFGSNYMTTKSQGKKLNPLKLSDSKIREAPEKDCEEEHYQEKEQSLLQKLNSQDKAKGNVLSSIIPRICSKRSDLQRKINNKDILANVENTGTRTSLAETNRPRFVNPLAIQSQTVKFTRSSDILNLAPKINADILSNTINVTGNVNMNPATHAVMKSKLSLKSGKSESDLRLRVSKPKGIIFSSPKSEKEVYRRNSSPLSDNIPEFTTRASRKCSTLNESDLVRRRQLSNGMGKKHSIFKNLRKHRSMAGAGKKGAKLRSDIGTLSSAAKNAESETKCEGSEAITMPDKGKSNILKMKIKTSIFTDHMVTNSAEVIAEQFCRITSTNDCTPASIAELAKEQPSPEEHMHLPTSPNQLEKPCRDRASDEIASANDPMADEVRTRVEEHSCQDSSACLSNQEDTEIEIPQENSSITSNRKMSSNTDNSIVSTASTLSPSSPNEPNGSKIEENLKLKLSSMSSIEVAEGTNTGNAEAIVSAKELVQVQSPDAQVCCCSRRDYLPREPQFSKIHVNSGKQMVSNLQIRPISPSFSHCSTFQADMESPTASMCTMASSDSAAKLPTIHDFSSPSPTQSRSKPVLRLMGKNLTLECKEETHTQLPSPTSDTMTLKHLSNHGFSNHHPYQQQQQQHFMGVPLVFSQASSISSNQMALHSYGMPVRDFVVIDDPTDHERVQRATNTSSATIPASNLLQHRPVYPYFQQHSQLIPMEFHGGFRPSFDNARAVQRSGALGDSVPLPQSAFRFPSPLISHLHPSFFYPETMR